MVPTPGIKPTQFAVRIKMKTLAKNQNVRFIKCGPMMLSRKLYSPPTSHSQKFCAPSGTAFMCLVANWAKAMRPMATIQLTIIELVMGKPRGLAISTAFCAGPVSDNSGAVDLACIEEVVTATGPALRLQMQFVLKHANATASSHHINLLLKIENNSA